eukprot:2294947-Pleurochrysis_carterae.AAC.8
MTESVIFPRRCDILESLDTSHHLSLLCRYCIHLGVDIVLTIGEPTQYVNKVENTKNCVRQSRYTVVKDMRSPIAMATCSLCAGYSIAVSAGRCLPSYFTLATL